MSKTLQPGDKAPAFDLPCDGGGTISLAAQKGHFLVLYFYPKDDTSGCTSEAIAFSENKDAFKALNATIIGISKDSAAKHDKFKAKHDLTITLAADEDLKTMQDYGVWVEKSMYGRKYMGTERATYLIGPDSTIRTIWRKVRVKGHVEAVLKVLQEISNT